jgi:Zn-dependent protease with chaperone function
MDSPDGIGRLLIVGGVVIAVVGLVLVLAPNIPFLGRLPGDIRIENENTRVFIPLGTMLLLSIIATIVLNLISRR